MTTKTIPTSKSSVPEQAQKQPAGGNDNRPFDKSKLGAGDTY